MGTRAVHRTGTKLRTNADRKGEVLTIGGEADQGDMNWPWRQVILTHLVWRGQVEEAKMS